MKNFTTNLFAFVLLLIQGQCMEESQFLAIGKLCSPKRENQNRTVLTYDGQTEQLLKCFPMCVFEAFQLINEKGEPQKPALMEMFNPNNSNALAEKLGKCSPPADVSDLCEKSALFAKCVCEATDSHCKVWMAQNLYLRQCLVDLKIQFPIKDDDDNCLDGCVGEKMGYVNPAGGVNKEKMTQDYPLLSTLVKECYENVKGDKCVAMTEVRKCAGKVIQKFLNKSESIL